MSTAKTSRSSRWFERELVVQLVILLLVVVSFMSWYSSSSSCSHRPRAAQDRAIRARFLERLDLAALYQSAVNTGIRPGASSGFSRPVREF